MTITIKDGDEETVFNDVLDYYISVRQVVPLMNDKAMAKEIQTKSYSKGSAIREIVKELRQSIIELEDHLRGLS